jgi:hypothetical protein
MSMTPAEITEKLITDLKLPNMVMVRYPRWAPTENIADAWDVVEAMRRKGWGAVVNARAVGEPRPSDWEGDYHAAFYPRGVVYERAQVGHGYGDSFPEAICNAAIFTLGRWGPGVALRLCCL